MRTRTKIIIVLSALCAGTLALAACNENPHTDHAKQGYSVSVRWDSNGGLVESRPDTHIVDDYRYEDVFKENGVRLFPPDDPVRGGKLKNVERSGYFLAGWYRERNPRVNGQGEPLDMYGNVCVETPKVDEYGNPVYDEEGNQAVEYLSEEGLSQAYSYAGKWDFENDRLDAEELGDFEYKEGEYALTLYAAWVPMFRYEIYGQVKEYQCAACGALYYVTAPDSCTNLVGDGNGGTKFCGGTVEDKGNHWQPVAVGGEYNPEGGNKAEIPVPTWEKPNEEGGSEPSCELIYGDFPAPDPKKFALTFDSVYATAEDAENRTHPLDKITTQGTVDETTATATGGISRYYARWEEGVWYRLYKAKDLSDMAIKAGEYGCYDVMADLDFTDETWPKAISTGSYSGHFRGNGHTISNVTVTQNGSTREGLFGFIGKKALFENISFKNITYRLETASRETGSHYGLFAGEVADGATFEEVSVQGTFIVGSGVYVPRGRPDSSGSLTYPYDVGLYTGSLTKKGIAFEVSLEVEDENKRSAEIVDEETGELKITES